MKTTLSAILAVSLTATSMLSAADPPPPAQPNPAPRSDASAEKQAQASPANQTKDGAQAQPANSSASGELHMNFEDASLESVLKYLSEAAGFIITVKPGTSIRGKVTIFSGQPVSKDDAVDLLDTALLQNGLAAVRNGRRITIVNRDEAKTQHIPVMKEADPDKIPMSDQIMTYIIPVRFVEVTQLIKDIQPLVSMQTSMTANEAGNSVIITDTQANIHRVAEVIKDIDGGAEDFTDMRVFPLTNSDPNDIADLLTSLFPDDSRSGGNTQSPFGGRFGRFFGRGGGPFGGGNQGGGNTASDAQNQRIKKRNRVIAVADQRTASIVVSASRDMMDQIAEVIKDIDTNPKGKMMVSVLKTPNADPEVVKQLLQDVFPSQSRNQQRSTSTTSTSALSYRQQQQTTGQGSSSSRTTSSMTGSRGGNLPSFQ